MAKAKRVTFTEELPVELTDKERLAKGDALVELLKQVADLEEQKKAATSGLNAKIKENKIAAGKLASELKNGTELRSVECFERPDYKRSEVEIVRSDTKEVVRTRGMLPQDRQHALEYEGDGIAPTARKVTRRKKRDAEAAQETQPEQPVEGAVEQPSDDSDVVVDMAEAKRKRRAKKSEAEG